MKNKKGFIFGITGIIYLVLAVIVLILLIWFGLRISAGLQAIFGFLTKWWWAVALLIGGILWHKQISAVINFILKKIGIKI